jgi:hypothetical protein
LASLQLLEHEGSESIQNSRGTRKSVQLDIEKVRSAVRSAVRGFEPRIAIAYRYGSQATGTANGECDFDFAGAALLDAGLARTSPDVDAVDLRRVPSTLAAQILESGIVVQGEEEPERGFLETRLMSEYAALNEERREAIEAIMDRGSVHARP